MDTSGFRNPAVITAVAGAITVAGISVITFKKMAEIEAENNKLRQHVANFGILIDGYPKLANMSSIADAIESMNRRLAASEKRCEQLEAVCRQNGILIDELINASDPETIKHIRTARRMKVGQSMVTNGAECDSESHCNLNHVRLDNNGITKLVSSRSQANVTTAGSSRGGSAR